jgi:hypothetical protein
MTPEGHVKKAIKDLLNMVKTKEPLWFSIIQDRYTSGLPDIIGCFWGLFFSIEVKREGGKVEPLQAYVKSQIDNSRGFAIVADSVETVQTMLRRIRYAAKRMERG